MNKTPDIDTLQQYGQSFQTKVVAALLTDGKFLNSLTEILSDKYFESDTNKWIVEEIIEYSTIYKKPPTLDVFKVKVAQLENPILKTTVVGQLKKIYTEMNTLDLDYIKDEFKNFCINQNLKQVILKSVDLLKAGKYDTIKTMVDSAMNAGVNIDIGHDYIRDFEERMKEEDRSTVPTPWKPINDLMGGGLGPGELGVMVAPSGVGKTWLLTALGAHGVLEGKRVVHYSLELSEYYVGARYDTVFSQVPTTSPEHEKVVREKIKQLRGNLIIKYFPPKGITVRGIQQHIDQMIAIGQKPDLVIIDYADLVLSSTSNDSAYTEQGGVYIELRGMGGELELPIWTASQTNRSAIDSEVIEADKIADSYAKVMNGDFLMSWSRKSKDKLNNTARGHVMKNRFGPDGLTFPSKMDTNRGIIEVYEQNSSDGIIASKEAADGGLMEKKLLHKKYVENFG